jgi:hypothetical protein
MRWLLVGLLVIATLLVSGAAQASSTQPLALTMIGGINSVGGQNYVLNQDGSVAYASIHGLTISPAGSHLDYSLYAHVDGLSATGHASIHFVGTTAHGQKIELDGQVAIRGMVPAEPFKGSAIPSAFLGVLSGSGSIGGSSRSFSVPVSLESPFINPFGAPIVVTSLDAANSIVLVSGYQAAKIMYSNVQVLTLSVTGNVGTTPVTAGNAALTTWAVEDLYSGIETEVGTISFYHMTPGFLDSSGHYAGKSIIPSASNCLTTYGFTPCTFDCTPDLPLLLGAPTLNMAPLPGGLCTVTGFISSGAFQTHGAHVQISGNYVTVWDIPAVTFGVGIPPPLGGSHITGTVSS